MSKTIEANKSKDTRLVLCFELLKTFTEKELNDFNSFLYCDFFNANKRLCALFKKLRALILKEEQYTGVVRLKIYQDIYKKAKQQTVLDKDQTKELSRIMNELLSLAEKFIMVKGLDDNKNAQYDLLFPALIQRMQMKLYNRRLNYIQNKLNMEKKQGVNFHTNQYQLYSYQVEASIIENTLAKSDNYHKLEHHLDIKYLLEKLQYQLAKTTLQNRYAHKKFNFQSFEELKGFLKLPQYQTNPLVQLYILNIDLARNDDLSIFKQLSELLIEKIDIIPIDFVRPFYTNLTNYCALQIKKGKSEFYNHLLEIYKNMHVSGLLKHDNVLDSGLLKNIITGACQIKAFSWANEILTEYINYVPRSNRKAVFYYNNGIIKFNQENYSQALDDFNKVRKIDLAHDLGVRVRTLQCFYETDIHYELNTQQIIDSIKKYFVENKRLTRRDKTAYQNFINIFNKLYKFKDIPNKRTKHVELVKFLPKIKQDLLSKNLIYQKQWLLTKIEDLQQEVELKN